MGSAAEATLALVAGMMRAVLSIMPTEKEELPKQDPPNEIVNPGDPGPNILVPEKTGDPRVDPKLPPDVKKPAPGV
jgi:hypothetical protein